MPSRIDLYIKKEDLDKMALTIDCLGVSRQRQHRLLMANEHVFYGSFERQDLTVESIPQLIFDLLEEGGVCTEAAEKLISKVEQHTNTPT